MKINNPITKAEITILAENTTNKKDIIAEHGLSFHVNCTHEDGTVTIVMLDTGQSGYTIQHNLNKLKLKPDDISCLFLSHGHYDHTGGLHDFLKMRKSQLPVYCHPDALSPKYIKYGLPGKETLRPGGIQPEIAELEDAGAQFITNKVNSGPVPAIMHLGEIVPREPGDPRFYKDPEGTIQDNMLDDTGLLIHMKNGLLLLSGCAHSGILNIIEKAMKVTGLRKFYAIAGGFHLLNKNLDKLDEIMNGFEKLDVDIMVPLHCTGLFATIQFFQRMPYSFQNYHAGEMFSIGSY